MSYNARIHAFQMGYAKLGQKGTGIHLRQFSRAFIIDDGKQRLAFVSVDCAMIGNGLRKEVSDIINIENTYSLSDVKPQGNKSFVEPCYRLQCVLLVTWTEPR